MKYNETDRFGRRFCNTGGRIEYEPTIRIDGVEVPESQLEAFHANRRAQREREQREMMERMRNAPPPQNCPFCSGIKRECSRNACALFDDEMCVLSKIGTTAQTDTQGKKCPFSPLLCNDNCALYKNGCVLTALNKERI